MSNSQSESSVFSVRIVSIDHYMAPPIPDFDICYSSFQGGKVDEVPVIRVYGSTPAGQKTCLHIHRALPYLYAPLADLLPDSTPTHLEADDACTHALALTLEKALKLKGAAGSKQQHVHGCTLVRAKKFYGYHSSEELFVKIHLSLAMVFQAGSLLDKILQPHESHIPFILQFLVHAESRGDPRPDPRFDAVNVIALAIQNDYDYVTEVYVLLYSNAGFCQRSHDGIFGFKVFVFDEEKHLFGCSLGFLAERASYLGIGLLNKISRTPSETKIKAEETNTSEKGLEDELLLQPLVADNVVTEDAIIEDEF
ncbi:hypothetical protein F3Y22_tig00110940pilonHSYRG00044 [Hibiscus syriacus]|uniref:Uncharacterized protein n=1 Tax=Hibiscus syriacus TaxID=106335 RepID=A0A6A2ZC54_HIBSY|nr:hypothetical protein F3Y22_tig00110940pilonHSYRG00044 [Hibiscus syriacus]